ncbi:GTP-binding protein Obg [Salpingoeca rosetta]|uniref:GTP-binding protein Obg n=1 Tax=Salpingoeca rosetta (strain ATCC 50818 / BSB-021) TaxID=946362 RepID=F2UC38_SALR5|nr:GTP-binding protein Obg [Salpingoeca rosetta]EGD74145.1 GTP-binding protein Obg [Salpingoeca rosetta]|eukprot:XP_004993046.1 GTP-binding protein Obg [Salpingoeca rosetta]
MRLAASFVRFAATAQRRCHVAGAGGVGGTSTAVCRAMSSGSSESSFVDRARIFVVGGTGGQGHKRMGSAGGDGGNVFVQADASIHNLRDIAQKHRFKAGPGDPGSKKYKSVPGEDVVVKVPVGTSIYLDSGRPMGDLTFHAETLLVARGGEGGSALTNQNYSGLKGDRLHIVLELKSIADVGLVGFPNAGKSSLLGALSRAKPRVANYPFTTLRPNIGVLQYDDFSQLRMADIPGLIEGAHENRGMGHAFLRHIERTKVLLYVIDVNGFQLGPDHPYRTATQTLALLAAELDHYDPNLRRSCPAIVALNKMDLPDVEAKADEFCNACKQILPNTHVHRISTQTGEGLPDLAIAVKDTVESTHNTTAPAVTSSDNDGGDTADFERFLHAQDLELSRSATKHDLGGR